MQISTLVSGAGQTAGDLYVVDQDQVDLASGTDEDDNREEITDNERDGEDSAQAISDLC